MNTPRFDPKPLERALATLKEALAVKRPTKLERDGIIQRFEYTFELSWKTIRHFLVALGRVDVSGSPKPIFRDALGEGLIADPEPWFDFLDARNLSTHIYSEQQARSVLKAARRFPRYVEHLLVELKRPQLFRPRNP